MTNFVSIETGAAPARRSLGQINTGFFFPLCTFSHGPGTLAAGEQQLEVLVAGTFVLPSPALALGGDAPLCLSIPARLHGMPRDAQGQPSLISVHSQRVPAMQRAGGEGAAAAQPLSLFSLSLTLDLKW